MLLKCCILLAMAGLSLSAVSREYLPPIPEKFEGQQGCYIREIDQVIPFNSTLDPPEQCQRVRCDNVFIIRETCGTIGIADPDCYLTEIDYCKPYPDCCPTVECNKPF